MSQEENMIRKYLLVILLGGESEIPTQAQPAFDDIFDQPHDWLHVRLPQEDAKRLRYKNRGELVKSREQDFADCLKRNSPKSK